MDPDERARLIEHLAPDPAARFVRQAAKKLLR